MPACEIREQYHELVDRRDQLTLLERLQLERIEVRLDAEDRDPKLDARNRQWDQERSELLDSIEGLLTRLRRPPL